MSSANPLFFAVPGAPYAPGDRVRVVGVSDDTGYPEMVGRVGTVKYLEYSCGCGQVYPTDPMIGVEIDGGSSDKESHEFWKEELCLELSKQ